VEIYGVELHHFHGFYFFDSRFFGNAIFPYILVVFEMSRIGYVPDIANFIAQMLEVAIDEIERNKSPAIAQMYIAVNGGATDIHAYVARVEWLKSFFFSAQGI
jgi:hypothetical protein